MEKKVKAIYIIIFPKILYKPKINLSFFGYY